MTQKMWRWALGLFWVVAVAVLLGLLQFLPPVRRWLRSIQFPSPLGNQPGAQQPPALPPSKKRR